MIDPETGGQTPVISLVLRFIFNNNIFIFKWTLNCYQFLFKSFDIYKINSGLPDISLVGIGIQATERCFILGLIMPSGWGFDFN